MKWTQHDTDAHRDRKLIDLMDLYGAEGYGVYWVTVELIAARLDSQNVTMELEEESYHIARAMGGRTPTDRVDAILKKCLDLRLFDMGPNGRIRCLTLLKKLDTVSTRCESIKGMRDQMRRFEPTSNNVRRRTDVPTDKQTDLLSAADEPGPFDCFGIDEIEKRLKNPMYSGLLRDDLEKRRDFLLSQEKVS